MGKFVIGNDGKAYWITTNEETVVTGTDRRSRKEPELSLRLKTQKERTRQRQIAKQYLSESPSISNLYNGINAFVNSLPIIGYEEKDPNLNIGVVNLPVGNPSGNITNTVSTVLKAPGLILSYRTVIPRFIQLVKDFNGTSKVSRTFGALTKILNPKYTLTLAKNPELVGLIPLYGYRDFNLPLLLKFLKVWETESAKGPYNLGGFLQYANTPEKIEQLPQLFHNARERLKGIDLAHRYGRFLSLRYKTMYSEITDPALKHIADVSPLYISELWQLLKAGGANAEFVLDLIKRSNSYRRFMRKPYSSEDFGTFKGHTMKGTKSGNSSIDVEGRFRSDFNGEYGSYPAYFQGQPNLKGDFSTWWDLRIPEGVLVSPGAWSRNPFKNKLIARVTDKHLPNLEGIIEVEKSFHNAYLQLDIPKLFLNWPVHQVFEGPTGTLLLNFKITTGDMPKDFLFGKGYKNGGKLIF